MRSVIYSRINSSKIFANKYVRISFAVAFAVIGTYMTLASFADTSAELPVGDIFSSQVVGYGKSTSDLYKK